MGDLLDDQPRRPRRLVSPKTIAVLRVLGYRYSFNREAWVHRVGGGRFGPVFTEIDQFDVSTLPEELRGQIEEQLRDPSIVRMAPSDHLPIPSVTAARRPGDRLIPVRWDDGDEEVVVFVDGRPPLRHDDRSAWKPLVVGRDTATPLPRRTAAHRQIDRRRASATA